MLLIFIQSIVSCNDIVNSDQCININVNEDIVSGGCFWLLGKETTDNSCVNMV
jgi:hypothetical protein